MAKSYIVNMPVELFMDGYFSYKESLSEIDKLKKDRYLRAALILLFAAFEAELNRQLNITSYPDTMKIDKKLQKVLLAQNASLAIVSNLLTELDISNPSSFRSVRNGIAHFKGNYSLYGITEQNITRYFKFTKTVFEIIHNPKAVGEWIAKI